MKQIFMISIFVFAFLFTKAQENFVITGHLSKAPNGTIITMFHTNSDGVRVESLARVQDGNFAIKGNIKNPEKIFMYMQKDSLSKGSYDENICFLDKGTTTINGTDKVSTAVITSGKTQQEYLLLQSELSDLNKKISELEAKAIPVKAAENDAAFKKIQDEARPVYAKINSTKDAFVLSHPNSYVSLDLVYLMSGVIHPETFAPLYNALSKEVLNSVKGQEIVKKWQLAQKTASGKTFDFTQPDVKGNTFTLSSLRGKYVLVDFWASWCHWCRVENPNLLKAYQLYKDKNFEIVSISIDVNKAAWLNAVKQDGLPWVQVSDLKKENSVATTLGISAIPQNILVDPKGIVIAKNLRGEDLQKRLASIFK